MKNRFFNIAMEQASRLGGKPGRILMLMAKLGTKLTRVDWTTLRAQMVKEKFFTLGRMSRAYALGRYRTISWKSMLVVLAAIIYFVNPLDLIPDLVPVAGLTDDFAILLWVYSSIEVEIDRFLVWENSQALPV